MFLKTKWQNFKYWQRGIIVGVFLTFILYLTFFIYAVATVNTVNRDCLPNDPPVIGPCNLARYYAEFFTEFTPAFLVWIATPIIILSTVLEMIFGKILKRK